MTTAARADQRKDRADSTRGWMRRTFGIVHLRQVADRIRHRLSFVPMLYVIAAIVLVEILLLVDRSLGDQQLPDWLETTVDSARSVFSAMAGGLITSIALVLSIMLVAVQLASSQFSPRTLRDWLGNRNLQHTIGVVLGTTVFCLLALRSTRDLDDGGTAVVPHVTVLVAVALGVVSLVAVVRAVDQLTHSVRVGSVADRVASETIDVVHRTDHAPTGQSPESIPASTVAIEDAGSDIPENAGPLESPRAGWIQQIDGHALLDALPDGGVAHVAVDIGGFTSAGAPLAWIAPPPEDREQLDRLLEAFAIGDSRTMQQDVEFGLVQLTDIAVRALSPGVNDPTTACDVTVHIGNVLLSIWERPEAPGRLEEDGRAVLLRRPTHAAYLDRAVGPVRRYGAADPEVMTTLVRTLVSLRDEVQRRALPGPVAPLDRAIEDTVAAAETDRWTAEESRALESRALRRAAS